MKLLKKEMKVVSRNSLVQLSITLLFLPPKKCIRFKREGRRGERNVRLHHHSSIITQLTE